MKLKIWLLALLVATIAAVNFSLEVGVDTVVQNKATVAAVNGGDVEYVTSNTVINHGHTLLCIGEFMLVVVVSVLLFRKGSNG